MIIITYNDAEYLKRSIPSVLNQTLKPLEIIVIDDGSKKNEAELITNNFISQTEIPITFKKKKMEVHQVLET